MVEAPKSTSRVTIPSPNSQLAPPRPQAEFHTSFAVAWKTQLIAPLSRSIDRIASEVSVAGRDVFSPVPT